MAGPAGKNAGTESKGSVTKPLLKRRRNLRLKFRRALKSPAVTKATGWMLYQALRSIGRRQKPAAGSSPVAEILTQQHPAIVGMWHGQHLLAPIFRPQTLPYVALLSKNTDAELNAAVVERFGIETIRGSGGRGGPTRLDKGGAKALIGLRRRLAEGQGVCMIADVPKGTPREAGLGIITLARISGRPILPSAAVTSRRRVIETSWDKTTIPLPFGRMAVVIGEPVWVPADADEAMMEDKRQIVTQAIEKANRDAMKLADQMA